LSKRRARLAAIVVTFQLRRVSTRPGYIEHDQLSIFQDTPFSGAVPGGLAQRYRKGERLETLDHDWL
jgi:hypothetical protein